MRAIPAYGLALCLISLPGVSAQIIGDEGPSQLNVVCPMLHPPISYLLTVSPDQLFMVESIAIYVVVLGVGVP